jgi:streptogramin lyase
MTALSFSPSPRSLNKTLRLAALPLFALALTLTGCGAGTEVHSTSGTLSIQGMVHGGQQPVGQSSIQLYAVGKDGNGSPARKMLINPVSTKSDGTFSITGDYSCSAADDQVYLVATGGNPGLIPAVDNPSLVLMTAFGSCVNLPTASYLILNEVTTAAAAWTLAPFMKSATDIGASSTNAQGIASAFLNAQLLVDSSTGLAPTLPANLATETSKLYALGDALAPCVNSNGTTGCTNLFTAATPSGGTAPTNTLNAALNIVQNPGQNVAAVFNLINAQAPFPTSLTKAPNDWTMSLSITGGGLNLPTAIALDGFNNVWVANYSGSISAFSPQGTTFTGTGYGVGILNEVYGLAIDFNNNIWVTNEQVPGHSPTQGSITAFQGVGSGTVGSVLFGKNYIYDASIDFPFSIAADTNGDMLVTNNANSSVTVYSDAGVFVKSGVGMGESSLPAEAVPDLNHGVWFANQGDSSVTHLDKNGVLLARTSCCDGASTVATDSLGNAWITNFYGGSITELASDGTVEATTDGGGLSDLSKPGHPIGNGPSGVAIDAAQNVWVSNYYGASFSEVAGSGGTATAGTPISSSTGFGLDAHLLLPYSIAPDAAGNLWISNFGNKKVTEFFGLATPTKTPLLPSPTAP